MGGEAPKLAVYLANRPPLPQYDALKEYRPMSAGEIGFIAYETGNHWRKIFNVYAKLAFQLDAQGYDTWQSLRDESLLQVSSPYGLFFNAPSIDDSGFIQLVLGKTYAASLDLAAPIHWVEDYIGRIASTSLWIVPYFDYRQLSDLKLKTLCELLKSRHPEIRAN